MCTFNSQNFQTALHKTWSTIYETATLPPPFLSYPKQSYKHEIIMTDDKEHAVAVIPNVIIKFCCSLSFGRTYLLARN